MASFRVLKVSVVALVAACSRGHVGIPVPMPHIIPHSEWQSQPPLGYPADATRRNKKAGDSLSFHDIKVNVVGVGVDSTGAKPVDFVRLRLSDRDSSDIRVAQEGSAFNWNGFHLAVIAIYGPGELGEGLVALEVATIASLPPQIAIGGTSRITI